MKINNLFLLATVIFSMVLAACSSEPEPIVEPEKADTYVAISLSMASGSNTKALPNDYNYIGDWIGRDTIRTVAIYLVDGSTVSKNVYTVGASGNAGYTRQLVGSKLVLTPKVAIKTTPGFKNVYVLVNETEEVRAALATTSPSQFENAFSTVKLSLTNSVTPKVSGSADKIATSGIENDDIVMTNQEKISFTVTPNVTEDQALNEARNRISVQVQRAVARVMITSEQETYNVNFGAGKVGTISEITWTLAQGENSLYLLQKTDFTTPASQFIPTDSTYRTDASTYYDYSGLFKEYNPVTKRGGVPVATLQDYETAKQNPEVFGMASSISGMFLLPTAHSNGVKEGSGYRKGNTAYILVRAKFTPEVYADGGTPNADGTFYLGANGKFFTSPANGVDPTKGGIAGQTVAKYVGGKALYFAWINPDAVQNGYNSPVLRNNIYHVHISGFKTIGTNWNPLFPEDPNNPKDPAIGGNPDPKPKVEVGAPQEPVNPYSANDLMVTPESAMSLEINVLPWGIHTYSVDLGF